MSEIDQDFLLRVHKKASFCRAFEEEVFDHFKNGVIKIPIYLSAGQEYISATFSEFLGDIEKQIFIQHRGHSTYLNFGGDVKELIYELIGDPKGCANGMGGSASIHSKKSNIFGHDGLMGSHGPIATGACFANQKFTLCFTGDAAAEEDYFISSLGWASTKNLPIWFIVEDNNLSILTEKKIRRNWEMSDIASSFNMVGLDFSDDPYEIQNNLRKCSLNKPALFNIRTNRLFWHAGAGIDNPNIPDIHQKYIKIFGDKYYRTAKEEVKEIWKEIL